MMATHSPPELRCQAMRPWSISAMRCGGKLRNKPLFYRLRGHAGSIRRLQEFVSQAGGFG